MGVEGKNSRDAEMQEFKDAEEKFCVFSFVSISR